METDELTVGVKEPEPEPEPTPAPAPPSAEAAPPAPACCPKLDLATALSVCAFGYVGVLLRLALGEFSAWWAAADVGRSGGCAILGEIGHGFFLPNVVGCFLMGFAKRSAEFHWGRHGLLYAGFTTGLCGCLTTFATWNQAASLQFVHGNIGDGLLLCVRDAALRSAPRADVDRCAGGAG